MSKRQLDDLTRSRLSIARQLLGRATAAAAEPGTLGPALGVSLGQDALELILITVAENHRVPVSAKAAFDQIISDLSKAGQVVPQPSRLQQINKARVGFKHHGITPDSQLAKKLVSFASIIADEICVQFLGESIWSVSTTQLVFRTRVRNHLNDALRLKEAGDFRGSVAASARAFALTFGDDLGSTQRWTRRVRYRRRLAESIGHGFDSNGSPRDMAANTRRAIESLMSQVDIEFQEVNDALESIEGNLACLALGLDLAQLNRFRSVVPDVGISAANTLRIAWGRSYSSISLEDAEFAFAFAFDSIVRAQAPLGEVEVVAGVSVVRDTPIIVWPSKEPEEVEVMRVARVGERLARPNRSHDQSGYLCVLYEGEAAYVAIGDVELISPVRGG